MRTLLSLTGLVPWMCLVISSVSIASADDPPQRPQDDLPHWVEQLSSPDYRQRELASLRLSSAGMPAVDVLMAGMEHADLEARVRIIQVLQELSASFDITSEEPDRALDALSKISMHGSSATSMNATTAIDAIRGIHKRHAVRALMEAGVFIGYADYHIGSSPMNELHIRVTEQWNGRVEPLRCLAYLRGVETILLGGKQIDGRVLRYAAKLPDLKAIVLNNTRVNTTDLECLTRVRSLEQLQLQNCEMGDELIDVLKTMPIRRKLSLFGTDMTSAGRDALIQAFPDLMVECRGGFLGVHCDAYTNSCRVNKFSEDAAALDAGMKVDDVIVKFGKYPVRNFPDLQAAISNYLGPRTEIEVVVHRTTQVADAPNADDDLIEPKPLIPQPPGRNLNRPSTAPEFSQRTETKEITLHVTLKRSFPFP